MAETMSFEQSLKRLDEIVRHLERGDLALQESLNLFEEGTSLLSSCNAMLEQAQQKVVMLRKGPDRQPQELPFEGKNENGGN
jgi:exodeoxyribonuclease VII small subunit